MKKKSLHRRCDRARANGHVERGALLRGGANGPRTNAVTFDDAADDLLAFTREHCRLTRTTPIDSRPASRRAFPVQEESLCGFEISNLALYQAELWATAASV